MLNISGPSARWTPDVMRSFAPVLLEHADRVSALLRSRKAS